MGIPDAKPHVEDGSTLGHVTEELLDHPAVLDSPAKDEHEAKTPARLSAAAAGPPSEETSHGYGGSSAPAKAHPHFASSADVHHAANTSFSRPAGVSVAFKEDTIAEDAEGHSRVLANRSQANSMVSRVAPTELASMASLLSGKGLGMLLTCF
jgi:hypothetical protein